jgi:5'(3')-deoxyribonucleotidase
MKGSVKRISLDVDSTIARVQPLVIEVLNREKGTKYTMGDFTEWDVEKSKLGVTYAEYNEIDKRVWQTMSGRITPLVDEVILLDLSRHYPIDIITNRTQETVESIERWLGKHFPNLKHNLIARPIDFDKSTFDCDIFIDDSPLLVAKIESLDCGKVLYPIDAPWNREIADSPKVIRVDCAGAAARTLINLAKERTLQKNLSCV